MREALPNGTFFAFTGTPIDKKEKSTYRVFGPLLIDIHLTNQKQMVQLFL